MVRSADAGGVATWSLGATTAGRGWDRVRVLVWVPGHDAGAWVRYAVTTSHRGATSSHSFYVAQQTGAGWMALPATFTVGTPTTRTGSISIRMTYLRPYQGPAADTTCASGTCTAMGAAQVEFHWG
jgi:hypothetical protein